MSNKSTLFERIGGEDAVNATVERFYVNLLSNELTKPFFVTTDIDKLRNHQKRFLTYAFGGPSKYTGRYFIFLFSFFFLLLILFENKYINYCIEL